MRSADRRPARPPGRNRPEPGLLELRADPLGTGIQILLAVEPADTVALLAVLDSGEAAAEHGGEAARLAGGLLAEIREGVWPADLEVIRLADAGEFTARYFPADDGALARRACVLAGTTPAATLRAGLGVSVADLAARSGVPASRITEIKARGLAAARVDEAVALARALGARVALPGGAGTATLV